MASITASFVASRRVAPPAISTVRPSIWLRSSAGLRATRSMTCACSAAVAVSVAASRTAFSPQSALRPRSSARLRISATASLVTFAVIASLDSDLDSDFGSPSLLLSPLSGAALGRPGSGPPIETGVAAPRLVPGAITAMWVA